jgi:hypothetical protein
MNHFQTVITLYLELPPKQGGNWNWQLCKCHYKKLWMLKRGCRGRTLLFPRGGKGALFDIREIFKIFKKIITCSLHKAKITNYESIEKL